MAIVLSTLLVCLAVVVALALGNGGVHGKHQLHHRGHHHSGIHHAQHHGKQHQQSAKLAKNPLIQRTKLEQSAKLSDRTKLVPHNDVAVEVGSDATLTAADSSTQNTWEGLMAQEEAVHEHQEYLAQLGSSEDVLQSTDLEQSNRIQSAKLEGAQLLEQSAKLVQHNYVSVEVGTDGSMTDPPMFDGPSSAAQHLDHQQMQAYTAAEENMQRSCGCYLAMLHGLGLNQNNFHCGDNECCVSHDDPNCCADLSNCADPNAPACCVAPQPTYTS